MAWLLTKQGQDHGNLGNYMEFMVTSEDDINHYHVTFHPDEYSGHELTPGEPYFDKVIHTMPSSIAYTAGFQKIWQLDQEFYWVPVYSAGSSSDDEESGGEDSGGGDLPK